MLLVPGKKWCWGLFTRMVDIALVTAQLLYRHIRGTDILGLPHIKRAVDVTCRTPCISQKHAR